MKKRYLILAGVLALTAAVAGCGKKQETETQPVQASATPIPEITKAVVDMQQSTDDSDIKNVMGEKTATASKVIFVNETGDDIQAIYIRDHVDDEDDTDDDTWGSDLINGMFTLTDKGKALYYFEANASGNSTKSTASYDIRITYTDEEKSECFFRDIPLGTISQITLCMDGTDEDAIPYAKYLTGSTKKEVSTLNDVKERLGLLDDSEDSDSSDSEVTPTPSDSDDNNNDSDQEDNDDPSDPGNQDDPSDPGDNDDPSDPGNQDDPQPDTPSDPDDPSDPDAPSDPSDDSMISTAEQYIGQSLDALEGACGSPQGSSYEDDPETGKTGFHYYSNFTVSTTVDENGNEIVAGIW